MHDPDELEIALHPRLLEVIAEAAERFPDRQALVHLENPLDDKPRIWTFREVIDAIHRVAFSLRSAGVKEGDAVAILSPTTPDTLIAFVAASSVATAFPVNPLLAPAALAQQLALARARACIAYGPDPELPIWDRLQEVLMLEQPLELLIEIKTPASADHLAKAGQNLLNWNDFLHATRCV